MKAYHSDLTCKVVAYYKRFDTNVRKTAHIFGISKSSVARWVAIDNKRESNTINNVCGLIKPIKKMVDRINKYVINNPLTRLKNVSNKMFDEFKMKISVSSISRLLKKTGITYKQMRHKIKTTKNTPEKKEEFKQTINKVELNRVYSLDEVGFQISMFPSKGWSLKGTRCYHYTSTSKRISFTGTFLISTKGIVHWNLSPKAINIERMLVFLDGLDKNVSKNKTLVMDNLPVHHNKTVAEKLYLLKIKTQFIPPYSSELNPIEEMFSWIKRRLRYEHITTELQLRTHL